MLLLVFTLLPVEHAIDNTATNKTQFIIILFAALKLIYQVSIYLIFKAMNGYKVYS